MKKESRRLESLYITCTKLGVRALLASFRPLPREKNVKSFVSYFISPRSALSLSGSGRAWTFSYQRGAGI